MVHLISRAELQIRDPFVVASREDRLYFLYGTTDADCWRAPGVGFDLRTSPDLERWSEPQPVFRPPAGFWADRNFWAPEVHRFGDRWWMAASFKAADRSRAVHALAARSLHGPFEPIGNGPLTPEDWESLDGTLAWQDDQPWLIFCHEWLQVLDGEMCAMPLTADGSEAAGEPILLFRASEAPWARPVQERFHFVTDGPFLHRASDGTLLLLWSSFGRRGYATGIARSTSGRIEGPWTHEPTPLLARGGHAMLFTDLHGRLTLAYHWPNETPNERPRFREVVEVRGSLRLRRTESLVVRLLRALRPPSPHRAERSARASSRAAR